MKSIILFLPILFPALLLNAQHTGNLNNTLEVIDYNVNPGMVMKEFPIPAPLVDGNLYFIDEWSDASIFMNDGREIMNIPLKYNVTNNQLEILTAEGIKVCPEERVKKFIIHNPKTGKAIDFYNASNFKAGDKISLIGFLELIKSGNEIKLFSLKRAEILESTYIPTVDMGNKNQRVVQKEEFYLLNNDSLYLIPSNRKQAIELLIKFDVLSETDSKNYHIKKREDLVSLIK